MAKRTMVMAVALLALTPAAAFPATTCFRIVGTQNVHVIVLTAAGAGDQFFSLVGEDVATGFCSHGQQSFPFTGSAHARADGTVHFGLRVDFIDAGSCVPFTVQGTLNPPAFNTGTGFFRYDDGSLNETVTFTAETCPALPN
jgi:hypothetical protein